MLIIGIAFLNFKYINDAGFFIINIHRHEQLKIDESVSFKRRLLNDNHLPGLECLDHSDRYWEWNQKVGHSGRLSGLWGTPIYFRAASAHAGVFEKRAKLRLLEGGQLAHSQVGNLWP